MYRNGWLLPSLLAATTNLLGLFFRIFRKKKDDPDEGEGAGAAAAGTTTTQCVVRTHGQ